jgi:hypothetical protein
MGTGATGGIGNTPGYSSGGVLFGPNTFSMPSGGSNYGVGANTYGFKTGLDGGTSGSSRPRRAARSRTTN